MNFTLNSTSTQATPSRLRRRVVVGLAAATATTSLLAAAFVMPATAASASPMTVPRSPYGALYDVSSTSNTWASVSATFKVPTINCSSGATRGEAFGVEADVGVQLAAWAKADAVCNGTTASYTLDVVANNIQIVKPGVSAGDMVVASAYQTTTYIQSTIHDLTSGVTWVAGGNPITSGSSTEVFVGGTNTKYTWAPFTTTSFTKVQVNGDYLGFQKPMQFNFGTSSSLLARTSAIRGGDSFTLSYV